MTEIQTIDDAPLTLDARLFETLPYASDIYSKLRRGVHISANYKDFYPLYRELEAYQDAYQVLFSLLGYQLKHEPQGFYYFAYSQNSSQTGLSQTKKAALLIYALIEYLADNNQEPLHVIYEQEIEQSLLLDVFEHNRDIFSQADIESEDELQKVLRWLELRGFCQFFADKKLRFMPPVDRFLTACEQFSQGLSTETAAQNILDETDESPQEDD